jgi:hypothetical protein
MYSYGRRTRPRGPDRPARLPQSAEPPAIADDRVRPAAVRLAQEGVRDMARHLHHTQGFSKGEVRDDLSGVASQPFYEGWRAVA